MRTIRLNTGITLIELMVAMVILLLIAGGISKLLLGAYQSEAAIQGQNLTQKMAQQNADTIVDSLRAAYAITSGNQTQLSAQFKNGDRITYYLEDQRLKRTTVYGGVTKAGQVVSDRIATLHFKYYITNGADWIETDTPSEARAARVSVCVADGLDRATEASAVKLRNKL